MGHVSGNPLWSGKMAKVSAEEINQNSPAGACILCDQIVVFLLHMAPILCGKTCRKRQSGHSACFHPKPNQTNFEIRIWLPCEDPLNRDGSKWLANFISRTFEVGNIWRISLSLLLSLFLRFKSAPIPLILLLFLPPDILNPSIAQTGRRKAWSKEELEEKEANFRQIPLHTVHTEARVIEYEVY